MKYLLFIFFIFSSYSLQCEDINKAQARTAQLIYFKIIETHKKMSESTDKLEITFLEGKLEAYVEILSYLKIREEYN